MKRFFKSLCCVGNHEGKKDQIPPPPPTLTEEFVSINNTENDNIELKVPEDSKLMASSNNRLSICSGGQPSSVSCPHLTIEEASDPDDAINTPSSYRNNQSSNGGAGHHASLSNRLSADRSSNGLLTKTYSFKRIISFRGSRKEPRSLQLSFLGQIYRKGSNTSTRSTRTSVTSTNEINENE